MSEAVRDPAVALDVRQVSVSYGGVRAVDDVSFVVRTGTIVGLIGPNGAGKTSLFDSISGFVPLDHGRVLMGDRDITQLNPAARARAGLGRSFQDARLFASLTVAETLACALERHTRAQDTVSTSLGMPWVWRNERKIQLQVEELIGMLGLTAFRDKFISELSTGSRRIVDLACVLAHNPKVLLLDEPSSGIAQKETEALGPLLLRVKERIGCTMLLVEHDMPLVASVSDELFALETGRLIARGTPDEVTHDPAVIESYLGTDERMIARSGAILVPAKKAVKTKPSRTTRARKGKPSGARRVPRKG